MSCQQAIFELYLQSCCFCQSKPIAFLPFLLTSPSSLLKLPILLWKSPRNEVAQTREPFEFGPLKIPHPRSIFYLQSSL